jgi:hypothetical protein
MRVGRCNLVGHHRISISLSFTRLAIHKYIKDHITITQRIYVAVIRSCSTRRLIYSLYVVWLLEHCHGVCKLIIPLHVRLVGCEVPWYEFSALLHNNKPSIRLSCQA